jgi:hypothetical protein
MIPNLEQTLIEKIHVLPPEKQAKVLEYVQEIEISENRQTNGDESAEAKQKARLERLMKLSGMGESGFTDTSERVDEILSEGINKREGWSLP